MVIKMSETLLVVIHSFVLLLFYHILLDNSTSGKATNISERFSFSVEIYLKQQRNREFLLHLVNIFLLCTQVSSNLDNATEDIHISVFHFSRKCLVQTICVTVFFLQNEYI